MKYEAVKSPNQSQLYSQINLKIHIDYCQCSIDEVEVWSWPNS